MAAAQFGWDHNFFPSVDPDECDNVVRLALEVVDQAVLVCHSGRMVCVDMNGIGHSIQSLHIYTAHRLRRGDA
eukprot:5874717-Alexandrium_andersonii.AAC.1